MTAFFRKFLTAAVTLASLAAADPLLAAPVIDHGNIGFVRQKIYSMNANINRALRRSFTDAAFLSNPTEVSIQNSLLTAGVRVAATLDRSNVILNLLLNNGPPSQIGAQTVLLCNEVAGARALVAGAKFRAATAVDPGLYFPGSVEYQSMQQVVDDAQQVTQDVQCGF